MFTMLILKLIVTVATVCSGAINKQYIGQKLLAAECCSYFSVKIAALMFIFPGNWPIC